MGELAFAAGFSSLRQFNETVRDVFASTPSELRRRANHSGPASPPDPRRDAGRTQSAGTAGTVTLKLAVRRPYASDELLAFLSARAVPGLEAGDATSYRRVLRLPRGPGTVTITPDEGFVSATLKLADLRDLVAAVGRCRRLIDADADPEATDRALGDDPFLAPLVAEHRGRRSPGTTDGAELAVRAVVGQQVSVAAARTNIAGLAKRFGASFSGDDPELSVVFPDVSLLAEADPASLGMPTRRGQALCAVCRELAERRLVLDAGADRVEARARLVAIAGIGPWTADYVAMRALGDPDVFLPTDLGVRRGAASAGLDPGGIGAAAERWRPWRSYALHHLWAAASKGPRS